MRIDSTANDRVKAVRRLHRARERRLTGRTLVEGPALINAALAGGIVPEDVFAVAPGPLVERCEAAGSRIFDVSDGVLGVLATTVEPQDPVAVISVPPDRDLEFCRTLVAVTVGDPGNLGTLIRTAAALGWQVARIGGADPWSPKVLRASAGAQLTDPSIASAGFGEFVERGFAPIATIASGGRAPEEIAERDPIALLVGSEAH
jgi:TrmH family RNA methyltransferase